VAEVLSKTTANMRRPDANCSLRSIYGKLGVLSTNSSGTVLRIKFPLAGTRKKSCFEDFSRDGFAA